MTIAILSLTRDRLDYTKHCFASLKANAGCDYDHYVLDNGSNDGTYEWLCDEFAHKSLIMTAFDRNLGICEGLNFMLNEKFDPSDYDVIVRFDNDCEVTQPNTLKTVCEVALEYNAIVAPHVNGLNNPPPILDHAKAGDHIIEETAILGGIFMAIPASLFTQHGFRYDETLPPWTGDEAIVPWWRARGGTAGYLQGWSVNHYLTTEGQKQDDPEYQSRKEREMGLVAA